MAASTNLYAALAGYVGRPDQSGRTGVFRRDAVDGEWQHVLADPEAFMVVVHPRQPALGSQNHLRGAQRRRRAEFYAKHANQIAMNREVVEAWDQKIVEREALRV